MAAILATMVAWWNLGLPRLVSSSEAPTHARIEALERLDPDFRLLVLDQARWSAGPSAYSGRSWMWRSSDRAAMEVASAPQRSMVIVATGQIHCPE